LLLKGRCQKRPSLHDEVFLCPLCAVNVAQDDNWFPDPLGTASKKSIDIKELEGLKI